MTHVNDCNECCLGPTAYLLQKRRLWFNIWPTTLGKPTRRGGFMKRLLSIAALLAVAAPGFAADATKPATFSKDVAPIFQAKCQECHQPNSIAPMSLITFQEARPWARSIKERVSQRQMPPGHIDRNVGVQKFKNDMSLSDDQVDTIVRWVDGGALQGDPKDLPPAVPLVTDNAWKGERDGYGPPDIVV